MQESSVAKSLADFVCEQIAEMDLSHRRISRVRLRMGELCGVTPVALKTAFYDAAMGTALQSCRLEIEFIEAAVFCPHCHREQVVANVHDLRCPECGTPTPRVVRGREMEIASIETEDVPVTT